jgi:hypothetical protein
MDCKTILAANTIIAIKTRFHQMSETIFNEEVIWPNL